MRRCFRSSEGGVEVADLCRAAERRRLSLEGFVATAERRRLRAEEGGI